MQNTKQTQNKVFIFLVLTAIFCFALFFCPKMAYANNYSMPHVDIQSQIHTDATLNVQEQRVIDFDGDFTAVWWSFDGLPGNASLKIDSVSITPLDEAGNALEASMVLPETEFLLSWREEGGPGNHSYSFDSPRNTVYVFFNASSESLRVDLNYSVANAVQAYKDVGELQWKYVSDQWAEASDNISMKLSVPVPEGIEVKAGENIRAWGHGPLDGTVAIHPDGTVSYDVAHVNSGQFAEARVTFPAEWLITLSDESALLNKNTARLDTVLQEEQTWADQANRNRTLSLFFIIACAVATLFVLIWAIWAYFKHGREYQPNFTDQYWRDIPSSQDHPAVIARLWRWNKESADDFTATLMHLSHIGAIQINKGSYEKPSTFGSKTVDDYYITRVDSVAESLSNPIDKQALSFLFDKIANGSSSLWFGSIQQYGKTNAKEFIDEMKTWQGIVSAETNKRNFFEIKGQTMQMIMIGIAMLLALAGVIIAVALENLIPFFFFIPAIIVLVVIANFMPRRSMEGANIDAKSKALRNWLKDFSTLNERPPTDVKVWGEYMVYAFIFGVAKQVMQELQVRVPELFDETSYIHSSSFVPWYFWYSASYGASGGLMPSASDMFQTSLSNTMQSAQAALSAASGGMSSGGGFGGGFSGGGGGGFGGGGGAR